VKNVELIKEKEIVYR